MKKIALKRLTKSDLTFFIWHYQNGKAGNQKAINLNADIFADLLFPTIHEEAVRRGDRFSIALEIFGPDGAGALNLQRKIVKGESYKNWRLNGEFVRDDEQRFRPLQEGDLAVIEFEGDAAPTAARLVLIAKEMSADASAHRELNGWLGGRRMAKVAPNELNAIIDLAGIEETHPLNGINLQNELEDAAQGGLEATQRLFKRSTSRKISKTELKAARNQADEIGAVGEEFVNELLTNERELGRVTGFNWVSRDNAIAPFDFTKTPPNGELERIDVKTTTGPFRNALHMSVNELLHCADESVPYRIYRVYEVDGRSARLRISEPLSEFANVIVPLLERLPVGVSADSISIDPLKLSFGEEVILELNADSGE